MWYCPARTESDKFAGWIQFAFTDLSIDDVRYVLKDQNDIILIQSIVKVLLMTRGLYPERIKTVI